jgi:tetratricopeptide (TPR) repeat protein
MIKKKKKKFIQSRVLSVGDLMKQAEEHLQNAQHTQALSLLSRAENEFRRNQSSGKEASIDFPELQSLTARTYFMRAFAEKSMSQKIAYIQEATKRDPSQADYLLVLGACHLLGGEMQQGFVQFNKAFIVSPDDRLVERGYVLGLLAVGNAREAKDFIKQDTHITRLAVLREIMVGNFTPTSLKDLSALSSPEDRLLNGLTDLAAGNNERASRVLDAIPSFERNPTQAEALMLATQLFYGGVIHFQSARFIEAVIDFNEVSHLIQLHEIDLPLQRERLAAYYHRIAESIISEGDLATAIECWQHALGLNSNDKVAKSNLLEARQAQASKEWKNGNAQKALELWQEVLKSKQRDESLLKNVALALEKLGRKEEAIAYWRQLVHIWRQAAKNQASNETFRKRLMRLEQHLIYLMLDVGRPDHEIIYELESALKVDTKNYELRRKYAEMFLEIGSPERAIKQFELLERQQGESAEILVYKGMAFELMDKDSAARKCFKRALEIDPNNQSARRINVIMLGREAIKAERRDDIEEAIEFCKQQLELDPDYAPAFAHLASLYFDDDRTGEAEKMIERIVESAPDNPVRHIMAGSVYLDNGFDKKAEAEFNRAIELDSSPQCFFTIGTKYLENDETKKALKYFKLAAENASVGMLVKIGQELLDAHHKREAERYFDLAMKKDPNHPEPHLGKAFMFLNRKEIDEGKCKLDEAERLAKGKPEFADILEQVLDIKREIKEIEQLRQMVEEIETLSPDMRDIPPDVRRLLASVMKDL